MFRLIFLKIGWILSSHWLPPVVLTVTTTRFACRLDFNHPPASAGGILTFCAKLMTMWNSEVLTEGFQVEWKQPGDYSPIKQIMEIRKRGNGVAARGFC